MDSGSAVAAAIVTVLGLGCLLIALLYCLNRMSKQWKIKLVERVITAIRRRRNAKDTFRKKYGYSWDYFIAFKVYDEEDPVSELQRQYSLKYVLNQLTAGGLEVRLFYSLQRKEVFCKIRCPLERLAKHADLVDFQLCFDPDALKEECARGREGLWNPVKLPEDSVMTSYPPYEYIYGPYEFDSDISRTREDLVSLYKKWPLITPETLAQSYGLSSAELGLTSNPIRMSISESPAISIDQGANSVPLINFNKPVAIDSTTDSSNNAAEEVAYPYTLKQEARIFRGVDRLKLIHQIISYHGVGGCYLDPYRLKKDECLLAYSPLHDMVELRDLEAEWLTFLDWPWNQPVDKVKDYFGEKIGLYFKWLGLYTTWLMPAAVLGLCVWINIATDENSPDAASVPYFAGIMGLWSALFIENWKRTENTTSMKWGTSGYEHLEQVRPQFKGETIRSPVHGHPVLYFPRMTRFRRSLFSQSVISILVLIVIAVVAIIFAIRVAISKSGLTIAGVDMAGIISSILIALQIQFLNGFFGEIALKLNNFENHRTDTDYEDSLISKTFCFQFVNSFASLFYIAFVKPFIPYTDPCITSGCMSELQTTLGTIFLTRLAVGNLTELGIPLLKTYLSDVQRNSGASKIRDQQHRDTMAQVEVVRRSHDSGVKVPPHLANTLSIDADSLKNDLSVRYEMSEIEKTYTMQDYDVMLGIFDDYAEMTIQFGYTTMFVAAFPLAALLSFINNYVEMRVDGWKLCHLCRRPEPRTSEDIGTWLVILELMSMSSIFINSGLVAFTGTNTWNYSWAERIWIFILMASGLFAIRYIVGYLIPDEPEEVKIQLSRQEYLTRKVIDNIGDEDDSELVKNNFETPSYIIKTTDDDPM